MDLFKGFSLKKDLSPVLIWLVPLLLAATCVWPLFENDLFYLLKAGQEIINTGQVSLVESWSFTASGEPWLNHQWLSQVLLHFFANAIGTENLPLIRAILVFLLLSIVSFNHRKLLPHSNILSSTLIVLLCFICIWPRIQLRSELFAFVVFSILCSPYLELQKIKLKAFIHVFLLIIWSQLHAGTAWIGVLYSLCCLWPRPYDKFQKKFLPLYALCVFIPFIIFISPLKFSIIEVLWVHSSLTDNPELGSLTWNHLNPSRFGISVLLLFPLAFYKIYQCKRHKNYNKLAFLFVLLAISFFRVRALPYLGLFLFSNFTFEIASKKFRYASVFALTIYLATLNLLSPRSWGLGFDKNILPIDTVDFILNHKIDGPIMNHYNFGSYLAWKVPYNKVFIDSRETPFLKLEARLQEIKTSEEWTHFLDDLSIQAVLDLRPSEDQASSFRNQYPPATWALVALDESSVLLLRRSIVNTPVINSYEMPY